MYKWYKNSSACYAYLADIKAQISGEGKGRIAWAPHHELAKARWFMRGWTLQELLAPDTVRFFDAAWEYIGSLKGLEQQVARITGINQEALSKEWDISSFSTAQKFSWASKQNTTKVEDEAYCLIGLFNVSLVLLYGIGRRAFQRLQEAIVRQSDYIDDSMFVWDTHDEKRQAALFAKSPRDFENGGNVERGFDQPVSSSFMWSGGRVMGNFWLMRNDPVYDSWTGHVALLNCKLRDRDDKQLGLLMRFVQMGHKDPTYAISPRPSRRGIRSARTVLIDQERATDAGSCWINMITGGLRPTGARPMGTMSPHIRRVESMSQMAERDPRSRSRPGVARGRSRSAKNSGTAHRSRSASSRSRSSRHVSARSSSRSSLSKASRGSQSKTRKAPSAIGKKTTYLFIRQTTTRPLSHSEKSAFSAFDFHARQCEGCHNPGILLDFGQELCRTGQSLEDIVDSYAFCKKGKILSTDSTALWRTFLEVPRHFQQVLDCLGSD